MAKKNSMTLALRDNQSNIEKSIDTLESGVFNFGCEILRSAVKYASNELKNGLFNSEDEENDDD